jgi:signal transduction histidine kinase
MRSRQLAEEKVLSTGQPLVGCIEEIADALGSQRWLSATKAPIRGSRGEIVGLVEIARDITETKRQEQIKNEFIATVSHELRTPLTAIMAAVGCLVAGVAGALPERATRMLRIAHGNCQRLSRIVNDILDIEKIESGKMVYHQAAVDVGALVAEAIEGIGGYAEQYRVRVRLEQPAQHFVVLADPARLTQVLANLLSNAIKFSPAEAEVAVAVEDANDNVRISVRDHGPGIPPDYKERIFEKFVQVDAADNRQSTGTGLGLSIARQIVGRLGGEIAFEAAAGGGTIFRVLLRKIGDTPAAREAQAEAEPSHRISA